MNRFALALVLTLAVAPAVAATISATDASSHIGQFATVEGVVGEVKVSKGGTTFIDVGGSYPNEVFTGVIFASDASTIGDVSGLSGKRSTSAAQFNSIAVGPKSL